MGGHGDPFTGEFATGLHPEGYRWDVNGELTVGVVEDPADQSPNPVHWSVRHAQDVADFRTNLDRQMAYQQAVSHNKAYIIHAGDHQRVVGV